MTGYCGKVEIGRPTFQLIGGPLDGGLTQEDAGVVCFRSAIPEAVLWYRREGDVYRFRGHARREVLSRVFGIEVQP